MTTTIERDVASRGSETKKGQCGTMWDKWDNVGPIEVQDE